MRIPANSPELDARLAELERPVKDDGREYLALKLTADANGVATRSVFTRFVDWDDVSRRVEIRESDPVTAEHHEAWARMGQPGYFILDEAALSLFLLVGGNGLIERALAERAFPDLRAPWPVHPVGSSGFMSARSLVKGATRRAPTPKLRMEVLTRDGRRCRVCGRRPDDDVDVVLHVHHIRPWSDGGVTDPRNLLTLCHTCHRGIDPHFDRSLFEYVEPSRADTPARRFRRSVLNYRRVSAFATTDAGRGW